MHTRLYSQASTDSLAEAILLLFCFVATASPEVGAGPGETPFSGFGSDHFSFDYSANKIILLPKTKQLSITFYQLLGIKSLLLLLPHVPMEHNSRFGDTFSIFLFKMVE